MKIYGDNMGINEHIRRIKMLKAGDPVVNIFLPESDKEKYGFFVKYTKKDTFIKKYKIYQTDYLVTVKFKDGTVRDFFVDAIFLLKDKK